MKLIFRENGTLWVIGKDTHPDVEGAASYIVPDSFDPVVNEVVGEDGTPVVTYITEEDLLAQRDR